MSQVLAYCCFAGAVLLLCGRIATEIRDIRSHRNHRSLVRILHGGLPR